MRAAILSLLLIAAHPVFAYFRFEPAAPNDRSLVVLQVRSVWRDGCVPFNPGVMRTGNRIDVVWRIPGGGCPLLVMPWRDDVPLGVLEAGEYEIFLRADNVTRTLRLVVTEAFPSLRIEPHVLSSGRSTEVRISKLSGNFCGGSQQFAVSVNGTPVPFRVDGCSLIMTFPPRAPSAVTVRVVAGEHVYEDVAAVRYIDPEATPDESLFERVLVPVLFNGPGAFGSQWVTEAEMLNVSGRTISWLPRVSQPLPPLAAGATTSLSVFGNRPSGLLLFIPRGDDVRFSAVVRDVSRDATDWGTELPIVREHDVQENVTLLNVPFDPRYRLQLRAYGIDGNSLGVTVTASGAGQTRSTHLFLRGPCPENEMEETEGACNSNQPSYASLDLTQAFPTLTGRHRITIEPAWSDVAKRLWAFVSVTNNATQQVTTITQQ
jgi:hypothetical protein